MESSFTIPLTYKGEEREYAATLVTIGYIHKFHILVEGVGVYFEPDEERNYRAMLDEEAIEKNLKPNVELIQLIAVKIQSLLSGNNSK